MNNEILQILHLSPCLHNSSLQIKELRSVKYVIKRKDKQSFVIMYKKKNQI